MKVQATLKDRRTAAYSKMSGWRRRRCTPAGCQISRGLSEAIPPVPRTRRRFTPEGWQPCRNWGVACCLNRRPWTREFLCRTALRRRCDPFRGRILCADIFRRCRCAQPPA